LRKPFAEVIGSTLGSGVLLITCGLPGTWKTETSQEIAKIKGYPILRTDLIRLEVLENEDVFDEKIASNMSKRELVYEVMFRRAENLSQKEKGVILDATFVTQKLRRRAAETAEKLGFTFVILQTHCSEEASIRRILKRTKEKYESNALTRQAYLNNKKLFEPVNLKDFKSAFPSLKILHLIVDTEQDSLEDWYIIDMKRQ
jgi:predicted kinase